MNAIDRQVAEAQRMMIAAERARRQAEALYKAAMIREQPCALPKSSAAAASPVTKRQHPSTKETPWLS